MAKPIEIWLKNGDRSTAPHETWFLPRKDGFEAGSKGLGSRFEPAQMTRRRNETGGDEELREASMESLMRLINQLKKEIARYEAHHAVRR